MSGVILHLLQVFYNTDKTNKGEKVINDEFTGNGSRE